MRHSIFFVKQKTAYEMRISDWSSDVCSSDLRREGNDVNDVTDALKRWLDAGSVPLVLVGNMDSQPFFERNKQLCALLGTPLDLRSAESRVGHECVSTCRSRWWPYN